MALTSAIVTAVLAATTTLASAAIANGQPRTTTKTHVARTVTMHLSSRLAQAHVADSPPNGFSPGDVLVLTEQLLNSHGRQVGTDAASCTRLFDTRSVCTGVYVFGRGQIMIQLLQPNLTGTRTFTEVITGGTGAYVGATGTVTDNQGGPNDRLTFHVRLP
jgi:hypothetical protein